MFSELSGHSVVSLISEQTLIEKIQILGAVMELPAKQHCQFSQFGPFLFSMHQNKAEFINLDDSAVINFITLTYLVNAQDGLNEQEGNFTKMNNQAGWNKRAGGQILKP